MMKPRIWALVAVAVLWGAAPTASAPPQAGDGRAALLAHYSTRQYRAANVTEADLQMVGRAAVQQCDPLDGRGDGMIFAHGRCAFSPGMTHCGGGPGLDDFDALGTLVDWVEKGRAPSWLVARGNAFPGQSRPVCAFPAHAVFRAGSGREAGDYECRRS